MSDSKKAAAGHMNIMKPHIAIIDDGINEKLYKSGPLKYNIQISPERNISERVGYNPFLPSHATTCAAIIKKYAPKATISSIKILSEESRRGLKAQLIRAIEWCVENKINIINLSLGTIDYRDFPEIEKVVNDAYLNNLIIVASCNNRGVFTCPASLKNVIGVKCDLSGTLKETEYIYNLFQPDEIDITACGSHKLQKFSGEYKHTTACNSFATPVITALAYGILEEFSGIHVDNLKIELKERAAYSNSDSPIFYDRMQTEIEVPIILLYNHCSTKNELCKNLNRHFRKSGYNSIAVFMGAAEEEPCNGYVSVKKEYPGTQIPLIKSIKLVNQVYDPDIIFVETDSIKANQDLSIISIMSSGEVDMVMNMYDAFNLEIVCNDEKKRFTLLSDADTDNIYTYITTMFDRDQGPKTI